MIYQYDTETVLNETAGLSLLEQGVYRVMMDNYIESNGFVLPAKHGGLTEGANLHHLARIIGAKSEPELLATGKIAMSFFVREDDELHHPRLKSLISKPKAKRSEQIEQDSFFANSSQDHLLSIPFGSSDHIFWWAPSEEEIQSFASEFRLCNIKAEIEQARQVAMQPTVRPRTDPRTFLRNRIRVSNKLIEEKLSNSGVTILSRESPRFVEFITAYPRQADIQAAWSVWGLIGFDDDEALFKQLTVGLKKWKLSNEWARKEAGTIPTAAQFLNARQWETDPRLGRDAATKVAITTLSFNGAAESSKGAL